MKGARRIQITHIHKKDAHYERREGMIGLKGEFNPDGFKSLFLGYYGGDFIADNSKRYLFFIGVRYRRI